MRIAFYISLVIGLLLSSTAVAQDRTTWTVAPDGEITSITEALERALPGDRIEVHSGTYTESPLMVTKRVELVGIDHPVIDAGGENEGVTITADSTVFQGFTVKNVTSSYTRDRAGIRVANASHVRIASNIVEDTFFGIYLARSKHVEVEDNEVRGVPKREANTGNGIHLWNSDNIRVDRNKVSGHRDGIYIEFAEASSFVDNEVRDNLRYGLHFMFSDHSRYKRNLFRDNGAGAAVMYSSHIEMRENEFAHNWGPSIYGLLLKDIRDSLIEDNVFYRNTTGIYAEGSSRVQITGNTMERNGWAVRILSNCYDVEFTRNNFVGNTFDVTTNSRRNPNLFEGNYWSKYDGYDLDGDGYGDVPHRPVRLFALIVERQPIAMTMLGSLFVDILDVAERVLPVLTPETLVDERPLMREVR